MLHNEVEITNQKEKELCQHTHNGSITAYYGILQGHGGVVVGVDPGVNFGITTIVKERVSIYNGKLPAVETKLEHAMNAYKLIQFILGNLPGGGKILILEGAAFNKTFGQVGLAEVRTGYYMGMRSYCQTIEIPAPMSVRKVVFGDGRTQAGDIWPFLNHNAADSLAIALYGLK